MNVEVEVFWIVAPCSDVVEHDLNIHRRVNLKSRTVINIRFPYMKDVMFSRR